MITAHTKDQIGIMRLCRAGNNLQFGMRLWCAFSRANEAHYAALFPESSS